MTGRAYYVYILASRSRTVYTGVTGDLQRRVLQHKEGDSGGFTARYYVTRLVTVRFLAALGMTTVPFISPARP